MTDEWWVIDPDGRVVCCEPSEQSATFRANLRRESTGKRYAVISLDHTTKD